MLVTHTCVCFIEDKLKLPIIKQFLIIAKSTTPTATTTTALSLIKTQQKQNNINTDKALTSGKEA